MRGRHQTCLSCLSQHISSFAKNATLTPFGLRVLREERKERKERKQRKRFSGYSPSGFHPHRTYPEFKRIQGEIPVFAAILLSLAPFRKASWKDKDRTYGSFANLDAGGLGNLRSESRTWSLQEASQSTPTPSSLLRPAGSGPAAGSLTALRSLKGCFARVTDTGAIEFT